MVFLSSSVKNEFYDSSFFMLSNPYQPVVEGDGMIRILVVEDNQDTIDLYNLLLVKLGYTSIAFAKDGETAVQHYSITSPEKYPEIILMDYKMPRKDGLTAAREILEIDQNAVIVFISDFPEICNECIQLGALMFSKKPVTKPIMNEMIDVALHARTLRLTS